MMMAHDSTPNHPELSAASIEGLRVALAEHLGRPDVSDTSALQIVLRRIAAEAREKCMRAEHLLIALKEVWFALPQIEHSRESDEQTRILQRVVTLCIREYYSI